MSQTHLFTPSFTGRLALSVVWGPIWSSLQFCHLELDEEAISDDLFVREGGCVEFKVIL